MFTSFTKSSGLLSGQVGAELALLSLICTADDGMRLLHSKGFFFALACCQSSVSCGCWDPESLPHHSHTVHLQLDTEISFITRHNSAFLHRHLVGALLCGTDRYRNYLSSNWTLKTRAECFWNIVHVTLNVINGIHAGRF